MEPLLFCSRWTRKVFRSADQFTVARCDCVTKGRFLARDVMYTSRAYATMSVSVCLSVCLSVTEVQWRFIANLGFKFRSQFTAHCGRGGGACTELFIVHWARGKVSSPGRVEGSSRAMLATARPSCYRLSE